MDAITTILWDLDGTLLDFLYSQRAALRRCFQMIDRELTDEMIACYSRINDGYWKRLELGEITKEELLTGRFASFFAEYGIQGVDLGAFLAEYQKGLGENYAYIDDSLRVCTELAGRVSQYVVTNGVAATQRTKLALSGLLDLMDDVFISEEIGAPKPFPEFFEACFPRIGEKDKSKILLVGDSLTSDIKGGVLAGIRTCWYRPEGAENPTQYRPDMEISDLWELPRRLQGPIKTKRGIR